MPVFNNILAGASGAGGGGYEIARSLRFNPADSAYLSKTFSAGNRKKWTWSGWVKRSGFGRQQIFGSVTSGSVFGTLEFDSSDRLNYYDSSLSSHNSQSVFTTSRVFRDPSAWMHIVIAVDSGNSTAADRCKVYINGIRDEAFDIAVGVTPNADGQLNSATQHNIGSWTPASSSYNLNAYLADVQFLDGIAASPTDFGETDSNGVWQPKKYAGNYNAAQVGTVYSANNTGNTNSGLGWDNAFNGQGPGGGAGYVETSNGSTGSTLTLNVPFTTLEFAGNGSGFEFNGTGVSIGGAYTFTDISSSITSPLTSIKITSASVLSAVKVDGVILQDGIPAGVNGFHLKLADNSTDAALGTDSSGNSNTWTVNNLKAASLDYASQAVLTGSLYSGAGDKTKMFDGTNATAGPSSGSYIDFTPSTAIPINSTLRIKANVSNSSVDAIFQINNSNVSTVSTGFPASGGIINAATTWTTISNPPSSLSHLRFGWDSSGSWMSLAGIEIDGVELVGVSSNEIDSLVDTPEQRAGQNDDGSGGNIVGNYASLNAAFGSVASSTNSPENGNLTVTGGSSANFSPTTIPVTSGKWYVEATVAGSGDASTIGVWKMPMNYGTDYYLNPNYRYYQQDGKIYYESGATSTTYNTYAAGDVIGIALDMDNGKVFFSKNGTFQGSSVPASGTNPAASGLSGTWAIVLQAGASTSHTLHLNAGQRPFHTAAPTGFKCLNTANLDPATIADGSQYFDAKLYDGDGVNGRDVTGFSMSPDFVWIKGRTNMPDGYAYDHFLADTVRGAGKSLASNTDSNESSNDSYGYISQFNSDGFRVTAGSTQDYYVNETNEPYIAWAWDAGSSTVTNTDGSITSQVCANQTAGFSICTYTGSTGNQSFGHGLNVAPKFILIKNRSNSATWFAMFDTGAAHYQYGHLDSTSAFAAATAQPVSNTTVTLGNNNAWFGANGDNYVAYCFAPVAGYSAFGSFTANSVSDGPYVFTGMRPRWIMIKAATNSTYAAYNDWIIIDAARYAGNGLSGSALFASESFQEGTGGAGSASTVVWLDILSNGFKIRAGNTEVNYSGTYVYAAFAEHPFQNSRAR